MKSTGIAYTLRCDICDVTETVLNVEKSTWLTFQRNNDDSLTVCICNRCHPNIIKAVDILVDKHPEINELLGKNDNMILASTIMSQIMWNRGKDLKNRIKEVAGRKTA